MKNRFYASVSVLSCYAYLLKDIHIFSLIKLYLFFIQVLLPFVLLRSGFVLVILGIGIDLVGKLFEQYFEILVILDDLVDLFHCM